MMKQVFSLVVITSITFCVYAQDAPNLSNASLLSPTTQAAAKLSSVPVNLFTGVPGISVPVYNYNNHGLNLSISLGYNAGGIQVPESPTTVGLGWYLNSGGVITRTVRGMPDDLVQKGYINAAAIPSDFRSNGDKYYYDSLDAQQDVFQFNFNGRGGKFFIGKNRQIALIPQSKLKIQYTIQYNRIASFKITTEDGIKYIFEEKETTLVKPNIPNTTLFKCGYADSSYTSAWYLSQIISAFNTDTIKINYTSIPNVKTGFTYPQVAFYRNSDGVETSNYAPSGTNTSTIKKISSINFPENKKIDFIYSYVYMYDDNDFALSKIKVSDSIFRFGYLLDYWNKTIAADGSGLISGIRLKSVTPYTSKEVGNGYQFFYYPYNEFDYAPYTHSGDDRYAIRMNARDHWGYYNGKNNGYNLLPSINGGQGANRNADANYANANALSTMYLPGGGYIVYEYELNDRLPYTKSSPQITISSGYNTTNSVSFTDVLSSQRQINFSLSSSVSRSGSPPLTGTCTFNCSIVNATNTSIVYATCSFSLYDLFYNDSRTWAFNVPDGGYKLLTTLTGGGPVTGSFPIIVSWENKLTDNSVNATTVGGLRIKRITRKNATDDLTNAVVTEYKYVREDGKSSGFLGDIPKYDYAYRETVIGGSTTDYTAVSSEPLNTLNYTQGSPVGYSRVEVIKGTATHNIGKEVYEFTNLQDVESNFSTLVFPYAPQDISEWGLGLPEKVSVYDSTGRLVKRTTNEYSFSISGFTNSNFKSIKLGCSSTTINGSQKTRNYLAQEYYPSTGRAVVDRIVDSIFHDNGSVQVSDQNFEYDPVYYNVSKITTSYDRNRGLDLETRIYYPYNYTISSAIGSLRDSGIISPVISTEKWITGDANPRIIDATITNYQQLTSGNIVPSGVYKLQTNTPLAQTTIGTFNPASLVRNGTYFIQQVSFPVYDNEGNLVQTSNTVTGIISSVILDYNKQYVVAKVENAAYNDIAYTSFESDGIGTWSIAGTIMDKNNALTGKWSYNLTNGNVTKSGLSTAKTYIITLWAKTGATANINGTSGTLLATQNGWNFYSKTISGITTATISGTGLIDELRLHPKDANMVTTTYEPLIGATSVCNANNTIVYNEYDNLNRLKLVRDKDKNIIKRYDYSDNATLISVLPNWGNGGKQCEDGVTGKYDSVYTDNNYYSDTYQKVSTIFKGYDYCSCVAPGSHPQYKMVNGNCELGLRYNTATTWDKIQNLWKCTYHYEWSDGSRSVDYTEYKTSSCPIGPDNS